MKYHYYDIRSKVNEVPKWFDENGVPRYSDFSQKECPNIYADEIVLLEIQCQDCGKHFDVEMHSDNSSQTSLSETFDAWLELGMGISTPIHYGDPPIHGCVGDSMNCYDLQVKEFWKRDNLEWVRLSKYEIELEKP